ncbi:MAG: VWA domain-containing protein [Bacteroidota bacterium]
MKPSFLFALPIAGLFFLAITQKTDSSASFEIQTFYACVQASSGLPLPRAEVRISDFDTTLLADIDGCFQIDLEAEAIQLEVSYPGFTTQEFTLDADERSIITLARAVSHMEELTGVSVRGSRTDAVAYDVAETAEPPALSSVEVASGAKLDRSAVSPTTASVAAPTDAPRPAMTREEAFSRGMEADEVIIVDGDMPMEDRPAAGQLTAGEVNDFGKWDLWKDVSLEDLYIHRETWGIFPDHRYGVQLRYANGSAVIDAEVFLRTYAGGEIPRISTSSHEILKIEMRDGTVPQTSASSYETPEIEIRGNVLWRARTDNQGRAELWRSIFDQQDVMQQELLEIVAIYNGKEYLLETAHSIQEGYNSLTLSEPCDKPTGVDVGFVIDATGSMGDELNYLASELLDVMGKATEALSADDLRLGAVVYRDHGDAYLTRHSELSGELETSVNFIKAQSAGGGGDTPEAVEEGLAVAMESLNWREEAAARLLFLVLDAPPHTGSENLARLRQMTTAAAAKGIRIIPVVCSGMQPDGEYLLRSMALATNGTYTFLTDHSGIGNPHLEPSTDSYEVEKLNELLLRLIVQFGSSQACRPDIDPMAGGIEPPVESDNNWTVYPNPTSGPTSLQFESAEGTLTVMDELGKAIRQFDVHVQHFDIDLGDLASGIYLLRYMDSEGDVQTQRLVLQYAR